jgi:predicted 3-demethylubiquinone-9 3-methyltransferase (glyoxalase superfamily)
MQKVTPFLWYDHQAEEAMNFYVSVFNGSPVKQTESKVVSISRYPEEGLEDFMKGLQGKVANGAFELAGQQLVAFDGGPDFKFNEAISLLIDCESQEEVDYYWGKLSAVPESEMCGWVKDKYGLSWQIIPKALSEMLSDPDPAKAGRAMQAMLQMKKIDIAELRRAFNGEA